MVVKFKVGKVYGGHTYDYDDFKDSTRFYRCIKISENKDNKSVSFRRVYSSNMGRYTDKTKIRKPYVPTTTFCEVVDIDGYTVGANPSFGSENWWPEFKPSISKSKSTSPMDEVDKAFSQSKRMIR